MPEETFILTYARGGRILSQGLSWDHCSFTVFTEGRILALTKVVQDVW